MMCFKKEEQRGEEVGVTFLSLLFSRIPSAWNIQYAKVSCFGVVSPEPHQHNEVIYWCYRFIFPGLSVLRTTRSCWCRWSQFSVLVAVSCQCRWLQFSVQFLTWFPCPQFCSALDASGFYISRNSQNIILLTSRFDFSPGPDLSPYRSAFPKV